MLKKLKNLLQLLLIPLIALVPFSSALALHNSDWAYLCSGFFITNNGYIGTAGHCVNNNKTLAVEYKKRRYVATLVGEDLYHDVAIYKIAAMETPALPIGRPANIGETVFILGYPMPNWLGYDLKIHQGEITDNIGIDYETNAASCEGNSGGPVVNSHNQVIGVLVAGAGNQPCSQDTFVAKILYIQLLAKKANVHLEENLRLLDIGKNRVYNEDINSVIIIYKSR